MAQLTWRDVQAPDFSSSMTGVKSAADMINSALGQAKSTFGDIDQAQSTRLNKDIVTQLALMNDPAAAKSAIPHLLDGVDRNRLSGETLSMLMGRQGQLNQQELGNINLAKTQTEWGKTQAWDSALTANRGKIDNLLAAYATTDPTKIAAARNDLTKAFDGAPVEQVMDFFTKSMGTENSALSLANGYTARDQGATRFEREGVTWDQGQTTYNEGRVADALVGQLSQLGDKGEQERELNAALEAGKISPIVYGRVRSTMGFATATDILGSVLGAGGGGAVSGDPSRVMNYEAKASGFAAVPDNVKTLGQASDFALQVNAANKRRTGEVGSSAMGLYQIVGDTMRSVAPTVFGANWKNTEFNAANQDKLGEAIFKANRGSVDALRKQWVSLSPAKAEQIRKLPWEQARDYISAGESGARASDILAQAAGLRVNDTIVQGGLAEGSQRRTANGLNNRELLPAMQLNREPIEVAQELVSGLPGDGKTPGKAPVFKGSSQADVINVINKVQNMAQESGFPITADVAALVIRRSAIAGNPFDRMSASLTGTSLGDGLILDRSKVVSLLDGLRTGRFVDRAVGDTEAGNVQASIQLADQQVAAAQAAVMAARQAQARGQRINIQPLEGALNQALANKLLAQEGAKQSGAYVGPKPTIPTPLPTAKQVADDRRGPVLPAGSPGLGTMLKPRPTGKIDPKFLTADLSQFNLRR